MGRHRRRCIRVDQRAEKVTQIRASAIVDVIRPASPRGLGLFKVEVWGAEPYDYVRVYDIQAKNDTVAARTGIQQFVAEMEALGDT